MHVHVKFSINSFLNSIGLTWINMVQQSLTIGAVNIPNIFNLAYSLESMLQSKPDLFAKTQIRIVSSFLSDGFCAFKLQNDLVPSKDQNAQFIWKSRFALPAGAKPSGHGTPTDLGWAVTAHRWPGVGRMPGVPSTVPVLFNALATSVASMPLGECEPQTLGGSFHP